MEILCPSCSSPTDPRFNFCGVCGIGVSMIELNENRTLPLGFSNTRYQAPLTFNPVEDLGGFSRYLFLFMGNGEPLLGELYRTPGVFMAGSLLGLLPGLFCAMWEVVPLGILLYPLASLSLGFLWGLSITLFARIFLGEKIEMLPFIGMTFFLHSYLIFWGFPPFFLKSFLFFLFFTWGNYLNFQALVFGVRVNPHTSLQIVLGTNLMLSLFIFILWLGWDYIKELVRMVPF